jgi:hypothetical protein
MVAGAAPISRSHAGYDLSAFPRKSPARAVLVIDKRLENYGVAERRVEERRKGNWPEAQLLTTQEDFVLGRGERPGTLRVACGTPGHPPWVVTPHVLSTMGCWCARCANKALKTIEQARAEVELRGGKLLSTVYIGANEKLEVQCADGHVFWKSLSKIINHHQWCPRCAGTHEESLARHYLEHFLELKFDAIRSRPTWLKEETGIALELDGVNEARKVAFEYQGEHHYRQLAHYGKPVDEVRARDQLKVSAARSRGFLLVVVPSFPRNFTVEQARQHVLAALAAYVSPDQFARMQARADSAPKYVRNDPRKLEALRQKAKARGDELLEREYKGFHGQHWFKCRCGDVRLATPANYRRGGGCIECGSKVSVAAMRAGLKARTERRRPERHQLLRAAAEGCGATLLATTYHGSGAKHDCRCNACGHVWAARAMCLFAGKGCPACGVKRREAALASRAAAQGLEAAARREAAKAGAAAGESVAQLAAKLGVSREKVRLYLRYPAAQRKPWRRPAERKPRVRTSAA